ncbi:hypothetical protein [Nocardiopsis sp. ATB16-24]|uniref:hypothetical protein n=1 Tax=Nocardiopsis sp. ATB16-24 TaxID=3019555 RepID=UPI00255527DA|nr:hypothetical protein [Nocardiopsis sp. ATB16-24]
MIDISLLSSAVSLLALLFEAVYVLCGIIALVLVIVAPPGRKGLVATGGALLLVSALGDLAVQGWMHLFPHLRVNDLSTYTALSVARFVFTVLFIGALLMLVLAAVRRPAESAATPPPPSSGPAPFPTP